MTKYLELSPEIQLRLRLAFLAGMRDMWLQVAPEDIQPASLYHFDKESGFPQYTDEEFANDKAEYEHARLLTEKQPVVQRNFPQVFYHEHKAPRWPWYIQPEQLYKPKNTA